MAAMRAVGQKLLPVTRAWGEDTSTVHREFHRAVYAASYNDVIIKLPDDLWDQSDRYRRIEKSAELGGFFQGYRLDIFAFLQGFADRGCQAVGVGVRAGSAAPAPSPGNGELEDLVMLAKVDRSGFIPGGSSRHQTDSLTAAMYRALAAA